MSEPIETRIQGVLDRSGLDYEILPCDPVLADTEVFCEHYGYPKVNSVNTILIKAKTGGERFVACVALATTRLDVNKTIRKRLKARRVSFASPEETRKVTGMELGGVTPVGLSDDLPLWVDGRVVERPFVILGGGDRSTKIKVSPKVFDSLSNAEIISELAKERD